MNRIIQPSFSNPGKKYECKYPWPVELYLQGRDDVAMPGYSGALYSFEIYMDETKMWFAGKGTSVSYAERDAWDTWKVVSSCKHKVFVNSEYLQNEGSICAMCGVFKRNEDYIRNNYS